MRRIAVFSTLTAAERGQRALMNAAIYAETVKVDSSLTRRGCSWGVAFLANQTENALTVLNNAGIKFGEILEAPL